MTIKELSVRYKIDINKLKLFEKSGLIKASDEFDESGLKRLSTLCALYDSGLSTEEIKTFLILNNEQKTAEQIKLLSISRQKLLDEIHKKQKSLDRLDYIIYEMKNKTQPIS